MSETATNTITLGPAWSGVAIEIQLVDTAGTNSGSPTTTGLVNINSAQAVWQFTHTYTTGFQGGGKVQKVSDHSFIAAFAYNPPAASSGGGGTSTGPGADEVTVTITDSGTSLPIANANVWISTDSAGANVVAGSLTTDDNGQRTFLLDAGSTYYLWCQKSGENPINGRSFVAVAD